MYESQSTNGGDSLFGIWQGDGSEDTQVLKDSVRRAEEERRRAENRMAEGVARWDRERGRLQTEIANLTTTVGRLRDQGDENEQLKRRLEEASLQVRQLEIHRDEKAAELESRNQTFQNRINELEQQLVEVLSRSGNDHRRIQAVEERSNAELEVHKRRLEIEHEQKLRVSEVHWKKEVRTLEKEIERLRREVVRRPPSLLDRFRTRD